MLSLLGTLVLAVGAAAQEPPGSNPRVSGSQPAKKAAKTPAKKPMSGGKQPPPVSKETFAPGEFKVNVTCPEGAECYEDIKEPVYKLDGQPAEMEDSRVLFRAEYIEYNKETKDLHAKGSVYYFSKENNEQIWCDELEFHNERGAERGKYTNVVGETQPHYVAKPGVLTVDAPFHFEGERAERIGDRYIVYNGWITNCPVPDAESEFNSQPAPKPWWQLRANKFDIIPRVRAKAYKSTFRLRGLPVFYFPWFYHPLVPEPRKSGLLLPEPGHSKLRGWTMGVGYFWAINRSYDLTYRAQGFSAGALTHHIDFRGKPKEGTEFDAILFGAQDSGTPGTGTPLQKYNGVSVIATGKSDLGDGWTVNGSVNYTSSFRFKRGWSQTFNEANESEFHALGYLEKNWSTFTLDAAFSRLENFQTLEVPVIDPVTNTQTGYLTDAVTIRKLPEVEIGSRDHDIFHGLPVWFSFDSAAGLLARSEPFFDSGNHITDRFETSPFTPRVRFAPHLTTAIHFGQFHIVPSIGIDETFYGEEQTPYLDHYRTADTNLLRSSRDFSLNLIFPSLERVYQKKTFLGDKLKHVIEPRATYRYVTGIGDGFNRVIRFDENDLATNTNEVEISLANRFYTKQGDSQPREIFSWEVAQKRYFDTTFGGAAIPGQRNVLQATADLSGYAFLIGGRSTSPVVSRVRVGPVGGLGIQWQADYDPRVHAIIDSTFSVDYHWHDYFLSGGNSEVHNSTLLIPYANQFTFRAGFGNTNHRGLNAAATGVYDYRERRLLYATSQVTYNTDCCGLSVQYRLVTRVGLPTDGQFSVSFAVANIGAFGTLKKQDRLF